MPDTAAFVDAEQLLQDWCNARTSTLAGPGKPLPMGVHLRPLRSPAKGAYALLARIGGYDDPGDAPIDHARLSWQVYASTKEAAATAAVALANELRTLTGTPAVAAGGRILVLEQITGPTWLGDDGGEQRYLVDALIALQPA